MLSQTKKTTNRKVYRFIAVMLAAALMLACSACSTGADNGNSNTPNNSTTTSPGASASSAPDNKPSNSPEKSESAAVQASDIVIVAKPEVELVRRTEWRAGGMVYPYVFSEGLIIATPYGENNMGYVDTTGKVDIAPQFDEALPFNEGFAAVRVGNKWGYIDTSGNVVIPLEYDYASRFNEGLAAVCKNEKWGFIDKSGSTVVQFEYDFRYTASYREAYCFNDGLASVYDRGKKKFAFIDNSGDIVIPLEYDIAFNFSEGLACVKKDGNWGYIDTSGNVVIPFEFPEADYYDFGEFHEGLAAIWTSEGAVGFIDKSGQTVIEPKSVGIISGAGVPFFNEGYALIGLGKNNARLIDRNGEVLEPYRADGSPVGRIIACSSFSNGVALIRGEDSYMVINTEGEIIAEHTIILAFNEGHALFCDAPEMTDDYSSSYADGSGKFGVLQNTAYKAQD